MLKIKSYPIPIVNEGYSVNVCTYESADEVFEDLKGTQYEGLIKSGRLDPDKENGFCIKREPSESTYIYLNKSSEHKPEEILVHELFHTAWELANLMDSEEYGARIYTELYREFIDLVR